MKRSTEWILTTHAGRLPNLDNIAEIQKARFAGDPATFDQLMEAGVAARVRKQIELHNRHPQRRRILEGAPRALLQEPCYWR
jgi:hypothetical protein